MISSKATRRAKPKPNHPDKMKNTKKQTVKILGYTVTVGSKKHATLVAQVKHFNQLAA